MITSMGQTFYPDEADRLVPEGCTCLMNSDGSQACNCQWCYCYYNGPDEYLAAFLEE